MSPMSNQMSAFAAGTLQIFMLNWKSLLIFT